MATQNVQKRPVPIRKTARWLGAGALGMVVWILLSVLTALLDFRAEGAGLIGVFDSLSAFLATGAALTAAPMTIYAIYRYGFGQRARIGAAVAMAAVVLVLVAMYWQVIFISAAFATILGLMLKNGVLDTEPDENYDEDGYQFGWQGFGYYMGGWRVDADGDDLNNID